MGENTKIEWAHHTFNPWIGCAKVAPECANCYAATQDGFRKWTPKGWGAGRPRKRTSEENWRKPLAWNRVAEKLGERQRVFCASLADVFDAEVDWRWRDDLFHNVIKYTPALDWLLLTKRPENIREMLPSPWGQGWRQVWLGTSVGHPDSLWRVDELRKAPAALRFLSCEPLLADLGELNLTGIGWVIAGGESGDDARPMHPDWARSLRDQCQAAGVPFFFKQHGEYVPSQPGAGACSHPSSDGAQGPARLLKRVDVWKCSMCDTLHGDGFDFVKVGKKQAGRLLDGQTWDQFPTAR